MSAAPTTAVDRFKALIFAKGGKNGLRTLTRIFQTMDSSGDRKLDHDELKYGLQDYGLTLSEADLKEVISAVDVHHGGKIDFEEFIEFLRGDLSDRRKALILQAFGCIDTDGSGVATLDEIRAKYDVSKDPEFISGEKTADQILEEFMSVWEGGKKEDSVTRDEFLAYYKNISASIDTDDYFELMIRNAWHLSGGAGAYENTSCRRVLVIHSDGSEEVVEVKNDLGVSTHAEILRHLHAQGVTDIAEVKLTSK